MHVHFFWIWLWLVHIVRLGARQVDLLMDCDPPDACLGRYGIGLATALLSEPMWLSQQERPIVIGQLKFSLGGAWPFKLWEHHQVTNPLYVTMEQ